MTSPKRLRKYYNKLLQKVGKKYPEMVARVEGHSYYNSHLHNIGRKWFFSRAVGVVGETATHALMGHSFYLKTYYRRSPEERLADYLRAMPHLSFSKAPIASNKNHFDVQVVGKDDEATVRAGVHLRAGRERQSSLQERDCGVSVREVTHFLCFLAERQWRGRNLSSLLTMNREWTT